MTTKLKELKAAYEAAEADCYAADAACGAAWATADTAARDAAVDAACDTFEAAIVAYSNADYAYETELEKTREENSNDKT
jgi:hypothetical protein